MPSHPSFPRQARVFATWSSLRSVCVGCASIAVAALAIANIAPVAAADLYGEDRRSAGSPYDDPRYAGIYGYDDDRHDGYRAPHKRIRGVPDHYGEREFEKRRGKGAYKDPDDGAWAYDRRDRRYEGADPDRYRRAGCVPRRVIRRRLLGAGWHAFNRVVFKGELVRFHATDRDGIRHLVYLDRCSGRVMDKVAIDTRDVDRSRYAYGRRGRYFDHRY